MTPAKLRKALSAYSLKSVHPAADIFPMLPKDQYWSLVEDVKKSGFHSTATCDKAGRLIDGRNRICASMDADVDLTIDVIEFRDEVEVVDWIISQNLQRSHLSESQRNAVGAELLPLYEAAAKTVQKEALARGNETKHGKSSVGADLRQPRNGRGPRSSDMAASAVGGSSRGVQQAKWVKSQDPKMFNKVRRGEVTLHAAEKEIKAEIREQKKKDPPVPLVEELTEVFLVDGSETKLPKPKAVRFNRTNLSVDWASWTWNPVTGCNHGCDFCYAREIAHSQRMEAYYPKKFEPTFHPYRLDAPKNTVVPDSSNPQDGRVFVCSMADLFGKWVPKHWIEQVFEACLSSPQWEYLFLTKWPSRYAKMPLLEKAWYGASVVRQADVHRVETAMSKFDTDCVKWISLEPMLGAIQFDDLSWCDLVVIGSQTATKQPDGNVPAFSPEFDWVVDVVNQCREAGVPYYLKANLGKELPGMQLPKMSPRIRAMV